MVAIGVPRGLLALLLALLLLTSLAVVAGPTASAAGSAASEPPVVARLAGDESDDPFHVSDGSLAVAVVVPLIFLVATGATIGWALHNRRRDGDDEDDA